MKWQDVKDYAKVVYANKFTFAGYALIPTIAATFTWIIEPDVRQIYAASIISFALLYKTKLASETLETYKKTKEHIHQYQTIDFQILKKPAYYCDQVGMRLAAREAGLEKKVVFDRTRYIGPNK